MENQSNITFEKMQEHRQLHLERRLSDENEAIERIAKKTGRSTDAARKALENMSPQQRFTEPEEVAHVVAMLCAPGGRSIHGQTIAVDGGQVMK